MKTIDCRERRCAVGLALLLLSAAAQAQSNPLARGPDPTSDLLNATAGPFAVATASVPSSVSGYGDARLRRHDDQHQLDARPAAEPRDAALGGGGTLMAARDNPSLKAAVPMTPWSQTKSFSTVRVPTLVVGAENDSVAPVAQHSIPFYTSLPASLDKAYAELNNASHFAPNSTNTPIGLRGSAVRRLCKQPPYRHSHMKTRTYLWVGIVSVAVAAGVVVLGPGERNQEAQRVPAAAVRSAPAAGDSSTADQPAAEVAASPAPLAAATSEEPVTAQANDQTFRVNDSGRLVLDAQTRLNMEALFARTERADLATAKQQAVEQLPAGAAAQATDLLEHYDNYQQAQRQAYPPGVGRRPRKQRWRSWKVCSRCARRTSAR